MMDPRDLLAGLALGGTNMTAGMMQSLPGIQPTGAGLTMEQIRQIIESGPKPSGLNVFGTRTPGPGPWMTRDTPTQVYTGMEPGGGIDGYTEMPRGQAAQRAWDVNRESIDRLNQAQGGASRYINPATMQPLQRTILSDPRLQGLLRGIR